jgi:hypothetical protein
VAEHQAEPPRSRGRAKRNPRAEAIPNTADEQLPRRGLTRLLTADSPASQELTPADMPAQPASNASLARQSPTTEPESGTSARSTRGRKRRAPILEGQEEDSHLGELQPEPQPAEATPTALLEQESPLLPPQSELQCHNLQTDAAQSDPDAAAGNAVMARHDSSTASSENNEHATFSNAEADSSPLTHAPEPLPNKPTGAPVPDPVPALADEGSLSPPPAKRHTSQHRGRRAPKGSPTPAADTALPPQSEPAQDTPRTSKRSSMARRGHSPENGANDDPKETALEGQPAARRRRR